jgi:sensor c-di-GMP phosphodiesterase-like protein
MQTLRQRALVTICVIALTAICGLLAGYWAGRQASLRITAEKLDSTANRAIRDSVAFSTDAHRVLDALNASTVADCSEEDLKSIIQILYHSHLLKDAGRFKGDLIACSATLGRVNLPTDPQPKPDVIGADGVRVYRNPPDFQLKGGFVTVLRDGDSFVVLNPFVNSVRDSDPTRMTTTVLDAATLDAPPAQTPNARLAQPILTRDSDFRIGDALYATRCSLRFNTCMTASLTVAESLDANRTQMVVYEAFGGVTGALLGLIALLAYGRRRTMEQQLRRAIRQDKLRVVYQPIVELISGRIVEAEALVRWTDEDGFTISPEMFVGLAEENGFVGELTKLVVRHTLRDFAPTLRARPDFRMNINVTASDLSDPDFLPMLERALAAAEVAPQSLAIEVTESSTARKKMAIETIRELSRRGHSVQIDDFGTGYSSLAYLQDLPLDTIKIDRAFTKAIGTESVALGILPQILAMAQVLNLQVIAEGIETTEQAGYFAGAERPVLGQGWLFSRPLPAEELLRMLKDAGVREKAAAPSVPAAR